VPSFDPRELIQAPFIACPECGAASFGILRVGPDALLRRCRDCSHLRRLDLPIVRKAVIYLDQFVISNLMMVRSQAKRVPPFYYTLYSKLLRLSSLQAIVCPHSEAHSLESMVFPDAKQLRKGFEMFAHSVRFKEFDDIRALQVFDSLAKWLRNDQSTTCGVTRRNVLQGKPDVWVERISISVEMPPIPGIEDVWRDWRGKSHRGLVDVFENTWKKQPERSWEYWRDREAGSWGPLLIPIYDREIEKWNDILNERQRPAGPHEMRPHHFVTLINEIAAKAATAGCPESDKYRMTCIFLRSKALAAAPFRQIAGSLYACLARKAISQLKHPTEGFHTDVDVMSCLLPYCDAMFMDKEIATYWREIQGTPSRRLPFETRVFSHSTKNEFLAYLDELEGAVPVNQRRFATEVYG
jgi:hypothetical protein